jgi:uncharacterized protein (TIGR03435 family)
MLGLLISTQISALAQSAASVPAPKLVFEVATVKRSPPSAGYFLSSARGGPGTADPGQLTIRYWTLKSLLSRAFSVRALQVSGPAWLDKTVADRYDIVAKVPPGASKDDANVMLQNLLVERFGLVYHRETRDVPGYELVIAKNGLKMKESTIDATPSPKPKAQPGQLPPVQRDRNGIPLLPGGQAAILLGAGPGGLHALSGSQQTLAQLTSILTDAVREPVVDKTGLTAKYDFGIAFDSSGLVDFPTPPERLNSAVDPAPSLFTALQQELGLRLDRKKVSLDVVVIDRLEKVPTEN